MLFRMKAAQQGARDKAENDKGVPAHLTPLSFYVSLIIAEQALEVAGTSVAPPKCTDKLFTPSFLPPAPTISSSCSCINCEPEVTAVGEEVSGEESNEENGDEGDEVDNGSDGLWPTKKSSAGQVWF